jgi:hypothetical protein
LIAPSGTTTNTAPTFRWNRVSSATYYRLYIDTQSGTHIFSRWYTAAEVGCATTSPCSRAPLNLGVNAYRFWVQTWNSTGNGPWSSAMNFWVAPGTPTLSAPSGNIANNSPTFTWSKTNGATYYYLWVNNASGQIYGQWHTASSICGSTTCSVKPLNLAYGSHRWWVQAWGNGVYGFWSNPRDFFQLLPGRATLTSPSGTITTRTPTFRWSRVNGATWYQLWISTSGGSHVFSRWYTAAEVNCSSTSSAICFRAPVNLANGSYRFWVQTWNSYGYGPWSNPNSFTVSAVSTQGEGSMSPVDDAALVAQTQIIDAAGTFDTSGPHFLNADTAAPDTITLDTTLIDAPDTQDQATAEAEITVARPEGPMEEPPGASAFTAVEMEFPDTENIPPTDEAEESSSNRRIFLPAITGN